MAHPFDTIDLDSLRASGGLKWTMYPDAIGAFVAEMDFGTAPAVTEALRSAVDSASFGYLPEAWADDMAEACAGWQLDRYGWEVSPERIRPVADVVAALQVTIERFTPPGSAVILPTPAYMPFLEIPGLHGRRVIEVPCPVDDTGRYRLDLDRIEQELAAGAGLVILCNPYNPVGRVFERSELIELSAVVDRVGGRVFADEIHSPLVYPGAVHVPYASVSDAAAQHTVTATSASKAWNLPGLKTAQIIFSNDADLETWRPFGHVAGHGASTPGVLANTAAYRHGGAWLDEVVAYLDGNRRTLAELVGSRMPGVRFTPPEGTYIGWLDFRGSGLPEPADAAGLLLDRAGVALTDGRDCGLAGAGFARLVFAMPRPILEDAVHRIAEVLDNGARG
jgi:cysteine-S-conjugate beta-lyase